MCRSIGVRLLDMHDRTDYYDLKDKAIDLCYVCTGGYIVNSKIMNDK
jgi:hypothetical protein